MKNTFTLNDFNLFSDEAAYGSIDPEGEFNKQYLNVAEMKTDDLTFDGIIVSPEKRILDNIFGYARALSVYKTKSAGMINVLMN